MQDIYQGRTVASQLLDFAFEETGAGYFTLCTGTTGDGTLLVHAYGEGRRAERRVVERPAHLLQTVQPDYSTCALDGEDVESPLEQENAPL